MKSVLFLCVSLALLVSLVCEARCCPPKKDSCSNCKGGCDNDGEGGYSDKGDSSTDGDGAGAGGNNGQGNDGNSNPGSGVAAGSAGGAAGTNPQSATYSVADKNSASSLTVATAKKGAVATGGAAGSQSSS